LFPALITTALALPTVPVAVNVTALRPGTAAVNVFGPTLGPNVQVPTVASPLASVDWLAPVTLPPPETTANVTRTSGTGLSNWSRTSTEGAVATVVPTDAVWLSPAFSTSWLAGPTVPVAVNVTGLPASVPAVAVSAFAPTVGP